MFKKFISKRNDVKFLKDMRNRWLLTLINCRCTVSDISQEELKKATRKTFDILELEKTDYGFKGVSFAPRGFCIEDLLKHKARLEKAVNGTIEIDYFKYSNDRINIRVIQKLPEFNFNIFKFNLNEMWIGNNCDGTPNIVNLDACSQWLILGMPGTGKSRLIAMIITNLMKNSFDEAGEPLHDFYFAQKSKYDSHFYHKCKHTKRIVRGLEETVHIINKFREIAEQRSEKLAKRAIDNIAEWNETYGKHDFLKRKFLIIDEIASFSIEPSDDIKTQELKNSFWSSLTQLTKVGRSAGIHAIFGTQRGCVTSLGGNGELRSSLMKLVLRLQNEKESSYILDNGEAAKLQDRECIFSGYGGDKLVFVPNMSGYSELKKFIPEIIAKEDFFNEDFSEVKNNKKIYQDELIPIPEADWEIYNYTKEEIEYSRKTGLSLKNIRENNLIFKEKRNSENNILEFVNNHGSITGKQATILFFNNNSNECEKILSKLKKKRLLQSSYSKKINDTQYFKISS